MKKKLNIGLLGLGTVGGGVPYILEKNKEKIKNVTGIEIAVTKALVRDEKEKQEKSGKYNMVLTTNYEEMICDESLDVIVELIGKIEPAKTFITKALEAGKHVVTANKDLLAIHGNELAQIAQKNQVDLYFEASVAGGIPILRTIANSLVADDIQEVLGIVNGTTNYMLTKMKQFGKSYEEVLTEAQELGFAESDPTNDVDGIDAAYKMVILSNFAYGMNIDLEDISIKGIRGLTLDDVKMAELLGYEIKLIGSSKRLDDGVYVDVAPKFVSLEHPLANVKNEMNAVFIKSHGVGESMYYGPGAGAKPTATSVVSDLVTIAKNIQMGTVGTRFNDYFHETTLASPETVTGKYYLSIQCADRPGQLFELAKVFKEFSASFDQVMQQKGGGEMAKITAITHTLTLKQLEAISKNINQTKNMKLLSVFEVITGE